MHRASYLLYRWHFSPGRHTVATDDFWGRASQVRLSVLWVCLLQATIQLGALHRPRMPMHLYSFPWAPVHPPGRFSVTRGTPLGHHLHKPSTMYHNEVKHLDLPSQLVSHALLIQKLTLKPEPVRKISMCEGFQHFLPPKDSLHHYSSPQCPQPSFVRFQIQQWSPPVLRCSMVAFPTNAPSHATSSHLSYDLICLRSIISFQT